MQRLLRHLWAGTGLFAALLTCSCQHHRCNCCCSKCAAPTTTMMSPPLTSAARPVPAVAAPVQANATKVPAAVPSAPVVHTAAKRSPTEPERNQDVPPALGNPSEDTPALASERFGHDPNYRWLVGTLDYSQIQRAWLLRYMSYEEDDRYGGCVTLVGSIPAASVKKGQTVRVEGSLIDPESRQLRPAFQVDNIRASGS